MNKRTIYVIRASLFYSKRDWSFLLDFGIKEFICLAKEKGFIGNHYSLYLNTIRGDNIRLVVESKRDVMDSLVEFMNVFFNNFFKVHPSTKEELKLPLDQIFLNFPNNSLQYNIFDEFSLNKTLQLTKDISSAINEMLQCSSDLIINLAKYEREKFHCKLLPTVLKMNLVLLYYFNMKDNKTPAFLEQVFADLSEYEEVFSNKIDVLYNEKLQEVQNELVHLVARVHLDSPTDSINEFGISKWIVETKKRIVGLPNVTREELVYLGNLAGFNLDLKKQEVPELIIYRFLSKEINFLFGLPYKDHLTICLLTKKAFTQYFSDL